MTAEPCGSPLAQSVSCNPNKRGSGMRLDRVNTIPHKPSQSDCQRLGKIHNPKYPDCNAVGQGGGGEGGGKRVRPWEDFADMVNSQSK